MRIDQKLKKKLILNLPYVLFIWLFDKLVQAVRMAPGADASQKLLHLGDGFSAAFSSSLPSFHPVDLLGGVVGAAIIWIESLIAGLVEIRNGIKPRCHSLVLNRQMVNTAAQQHEEHSANTAHLHICPAAKNMNDK